MHNENKSEPSLFQKKGSECMNEVIKQMSSHASVRKYKKESITKEKLYPILEAAQYAATSNGVQAYSVIHVTDEDKLQQLAGLSNNAHVGNCGAFLVFCLDLKRLEVACQMHGKEIQAQTTENFIVSVVDTTLYAQNVALGCESEGYGICYIGGVRNKLAEISELLGLPEKVVPLFGMTIGIPDEQNERKPRLSLEAIVHENTYSSQQYPTLLEAYDSVMGEYYQSRSSNQKNADWSSAMSAFVSEVRRGYLAEFLQEKGFLKDM